MLPTSHLFPINPPGSELDIERQIDALTRLLPSAGLLKERRVFDGFGQVPGGPSVVGGGDLHAGAATLAAAFAEFIATSTRLEKSYRELQGEVAELGAELAERNAALKLSLGENEAMRLSLERIIDFLPSGVLVVDGEGAVLTINPEARRLLGLSSADGGCARLDGIAALGHLDWKRFCGAGAEETQQEFAVPGSVPGFSVPGFSVPGFSVPGAGGKRWLEVRNRRLGLRDDDRCDPGQTILILRDVTAQRRMEQDREATLRALTLAEITTVLAHEIRNPLASLELFAGLIAQDGVTSPLWISHLRAGIRSLSGTVNNVLSFHGACPMDLAPVDLAAAIASGIEFVRPLAEQAGVSLVWAGVKTAGDSSLSDEVPRVLGSESALQQVVLNLVANAIRHTPAGGRVMVSIESVRAQDRGAGTGQGSRGRAVVRFRDTGCGIAAAVVSRIFEPGFSATGDTPGMGLAVCRTILEKHGGRIAVSSRQASHAAGGSGSTFELEFPLL